LLALAHLRNSDTYARLAAGFTIGMATVYRCVREAVDPLAAAAPSLTAAAWQLAHSGHQLGSLDERWSRSTGSVGTTGCATPAAPPACGEPAGSGRPRRGDLVWISDALPGSTHDLTAARIHDIIAMTARADVEVLADKGYQGAGGTVVTPHNRRKLSKVQRARARARVRTRRWSRGSGRSLFRRHCEGAPVHAPPDVRVGRR
jgi:hypothetical protein